MEANEQVLADKEENIDGKHDQKRKITIESGIIYLSRIPPLMNVKKIREIFHQYGEIGRIFLQPDVLEYLCQDFTPKCESYRRQHPRHGIELKANLLEYLCQDFTPKCESYGRQHPRHVKARNSKKGRQFTEGWVEFQDKRIAKHVAAALNNTHVGGKKRSRWHDELWNIKYLSRFKWGHLNERLAYEKAVHQQRMRTEISQVKREANFYIQNAEKNKKHKEIEKRKLKQGKTVESDSVSGRSFNLPQKETEEEILKRKKRKHSDDADLRDVKKQKTRKGSKKKSAGLNSSFLKNIFSGGLEKDECEGD